MYSRLLTVGRRDDVGSQVFLEKSVQCRGHQSQGSRACVLPSYLSHVVHESRQLADGVHELPKVNELEGIVCRVESTILNADCVAAIKKAI